MWWIFAVVAFAIALILHLLKVEKYVLDAVLIGLILLTVHLGIGSVGPWFRHGGPSA